MIDFGSFIKTEIDEILRYQQAESHRLGRSLSRDEAARRWINKRKDEMTTPWQPENIRDITIVTTDGTSDRFNDIDGVQHRDWYLAVILKSGEAHLYPYALLRKVIAHPVLDTSPEARLAAVAHYKQLVNDGVL
jgi:hypothetical protein